MIFANTNLVNLLRSQGLALQRQLLEALATAAPNHVHSLRQLVKFRMLAAKRFLAQEALNHTRQLFAGNRQHIYSFIIGEAFGKIAV